MRLTSGFGAGFGALFIGGGLLFLLGASPGLADMNHEAHSHGDGSSMARDHGEMGSSGFDGGMADILPEYLKIQSALARDEIEGVQLAAAAIEVAAGKLDPSTTPKESFEHYQGISQNLQLAARTLQETRDLKSTRAAFVELSKPMSMWVTMSKPENTLVMYCPMKEAVWVQHGEAVQNPYGDDTMRSCGQTVGGRGEQE